MASVDPAAVAAQAGITGTESDEIMRGREASDVLASPIVARAFGELAAYYATKQLQAGEKADEVMRWQMHRVALADVETTFRGYVATGEAALKRQNRFHAMLERAKAPLRRMARFEFKRD